MLGVAITNTTDVADVLPASPAEKLRRLRDGTSAAYGALRMTLDRLTELREAKQTADQRRRFLKAPPTGKGAADDHPSFVEAVNTSERIATEQTRLSSIHDQQAATWNARASLVRDVEQAVRDAVGRLCVITAIDAKLPTLKKGEVILDAIEAHRRRGRALAADLHRVKCAPIKSTEAKARMRAWVGKQAEAGRPYVAGLVEHGSDIELADVQRVTHSRGETVGAVSWTETDMRAFTFWLHKSAICKALEAEIDDASDDAAALDDTARASQIETISRDMQAVEYEEAALIWQALDAGLPVEHRADIGPAPLLGVVIGEARPAPVVETSPHLSYEVRQPQRGRTVISPAKSLRSDMARDGGVIVPPSRSA